MIEHCLTLARTGKLDLQHFADLGLGAVGHADHAVAEVERLVHVVRDHERGDAVLAPELEQDGLQLIARERVEHAEGFVEQQHLGLERKGAGDAHALSHALGEFRRAFVHGSTQTNDGEVILDYLPALRLAGSKEHLLHAQHHVLERGVPRQQRR